MKIILKMIQLHFKIFFAYRWNFLINICIDPLVLILYISVYQTIFNYNHTDIILGYTLKQIIWYFAATNFLYYLVWNYPDKDISESIISGAMVNHLLKPVSMMKWQFSKSVAFKITGFIFEFIPNFILYMILVYPDFAAFASVSKYFILTILSFILFYQMNFLLGTFAFKLQSVFALQSVKQIIITFFSGAFIPLEFFPNLIQKIINFFPFKYLHYIPVRFLLNMPETRPAVYFYQIITIQLIWICFFYLMARLSWRIMIKQYCSAGG